MIDLAPIPTARHACPGCGRSLDVLGFYIPGMRCLAALECAPCGRRFFGDLPSGHGLYYPMLLDRDSGEVFGSKEADWFAAWLRDSYRHRRDVSLPLEVEDLRPARNVLVLNCLDAIYGHALLKLLNAQVYLDSQVGEDLVLLVPRFLRWMVPSGAAAIWTVDLPLSRGTEWNDWLAAEIARRLEGKRVRLSLATCLPHARDFAIERFTGVPPFPVERWAEVARPMVTFVLREDRTWGSDPTDGAIRGVGTVFRAARARLGITVGPGKRQLRLFIRLGEKLRRRWPELDLAVAGLGEPGGLPPWIRDLRLPRMSMEEERAACRRYAASHLVIGVHGSNMLLPSAHAGASIEIAWGPNLGNAFQDLLVREEDARIALFRHRLLTPESTPASVAAVADSMLRFGAHAHRFAPGWNAHEQLSRAPFALADGAFRRSTAPLSAGPSSASGP